MNNRFENQTITQPLHGDVEKVLIGTFQEDYPLTEVELIKIKDGRPKLIDLMIGVFGALLGYAVPLAAKVQDLGFTAITFGEKNIFYLGCVIMLILFFISKCLPNARTQTVKKIEAHFDGTEKTRHIMSRPE